jgi:hypothetical protein
MEGTRRALLIGSPYNGLRGICRDVQNMKEILGGYGFLEDDIKTLISKRATRDNILKLWNLLIDDTLENDAVVIYYSGHGGLAEKARQGTGEQTTGEPQRFQFLVPYDFVSNSEGWNGILDIEISQLLFRITSKTENVTYIVDSCHSARLGRRPENEEREARFLRIDLSDSEYNKILEVKKEALSKAVARDGTPDFTRPDYSNQKVVRIAAAAADSTAYSFPFKGNWAGMMTEYLCEVLRCLGRDVSWLTIMLAVDALVGREFTSNPQ